MNEILLNSTYFGVAISIFAYWIGFQIKKKWDYPLCNPLLLATIIVIAFLALTKIDYETYNNGAKYITYFLTPATICLAVPLYKQFETLKKNSLAALTGLLCGCMAHVLIMVGIAVLFHVNDELPLSLLSKSVTTPIALGITNEIGGIQAVTVIGVVVAGILGAVLGPTILKICKIEEPVAQGLGMGTASHAVGTSKALEMGEIQAAMSSLAIVVTGLMTVIIVPIAVRIFYS